MFKHRKNNSQIILYRTEKPRTQICKEQTFENDRYRPKADTQSFFLI
jgi:hypothetical protein